MKYTIKFSELALAYLFLKHQLLYLALWWSFPNSFGYDQNQCWPRNLAELQDADTIHREEGKRSVFQIWRLEGKQKNHRVQSVLWQTVQQWEWGLCHAFPSTPHALSHVFSHNDLKKQVYYFHVTNEEKETQWNSLSCLHPIATRGRVRCELKKLDSRAHTLHHFALCPGGGKLTVFWASRLTQVWSWLIVYFLYLPSKLCCVLECMDW